jgi:DNA-directed RNA polymerase specialized sigma subunit
VTELALVRAAQAGDAGAMDRLLRRYGPRVEAIARRHARPLVPAEDLAQDGLLELFKAIKRFDPNREAQLWTYARYSVEAAIKRSARGGNVIKLPVRVAALIPKVNATRAALRQVLGREPTVAEVGSELDLTDEEVNEVDRRALEVLLIDADTERSIDEDDALDRVAFEVPDSGEGSYGASEVKLLLKAYPTLLSRVLGSRDEVYKGEPVRAGAAGSWIHLRLLDLVSALRRMPDNLFAVIELVSLRDVPVAEVATRLGVSERTVYSRYREGVEWLARSMRDSGRELARFGVFAPLPRTIDAVAECARRYGEAFAAIVALDESGHGELSVRWVANEGTALPVLALDSRGALRSPLIVLGATPASPEPTA